MASGMITPITFLAERGTSIQLFTAMFLHTTVVVVLQAPDVPLWIFKEMSY